jgi:hypothetical protein
LNCMMFGMVYWIELLDWDAGWVIEWREGWESDQVGVLLIVYSFGVYYLRRVCSMNRQTIEGGDRRWRGMGERESLFKYKFLFSNFQRFQVYSKPPLNIYFTFTLCAAFI